MSEREIVWNKDGTHSTCADVRVGALTVRLRASYWSMNPNNPGVPMWVPSVRRLPAEGDDPLAGPVAMGDTTPDREIVVIEGEVGERSIEAAQAAAARLLVRAYGPATAWISAEDDDGAPLLSDGVASLVVAAIAAWATNDGDCDDLVLGLIDAARALNSGALINGPAATVDARAYDRLMVAMTRAELAHAGAYSLRYARAVADALNDVLGPADRAMAQVEARSLHDRLFGILPPTDARRGVVTTLRRMLDGARAGGEEGDGDGQCGARVPADLPGPYVPSSLVGARCDVAVHEHGSHRASEGAAWVTWKDGQLVGSSLHDEARRGGAAGG